ncbi:hypothetical protein ACHAWF_014117 [Thalassiosira exigua]
MASEPPCVSPDSSAAKPRRYSDKLESLLSFLEEHNLDDDCSSTGNDGRRQLDTSSSPGARAGLVDVTNRTPTRAEEKNIASAIEKELSSSSHFVNATSKAERSKPLVMREKKYIWDDWEEDSLLASLDECFELNDLADESMMTSGEEVEESLPQRSSKGVPANAHQQLQELRSMSQEIQARASTMRTNLEQKRKKVEELHSIRVQNESAHVQNMKSVKQEWKKRIDGVKSEHERVMGEKERLKETVQKDCDSLEKKLHRIQTDIEKMSTSERDMCEKLKRDGSRELEEAKKSWQQAEKEELKKRDQKLSPKLKRDAAKAVEPKLRQLMERNKEEIERLERESARELDYNKLELYKRSNEEYKAETKKIRAEERKRMEKFENEWLVKLDSARRECEDEMKAVRRAHEQRAKCMEQQFNAEKQQALDAHEAILREEALAQDSKMQQVRAQHEHEMRVLEDDHSRKLTHKQKESKEELKRWKIRREGELQREEEQKLKDEHMRMKEKVQGEIDLVRRKLNEEKKEKMQQAERERSEMDRVSEMCNVPTSPPIRTMANYHQAVKEEYDSKVLRLEKELEQAAKEYATLQQKEAEESRLVDMKAKLFDLKDALLDKEDEVALQKQRLESLAQESEEQSIEAKRDGARRLAQAKHDKQLLEKELDQLIAEFPKRQEEHRKELQVLKDTNAEEVALAEGKVRTMIDRKEAMLQEASSQLLRRRQEVADLEREMDEARKAKLLEKTMNPKRTRAKKC